MLKMVRTKKEKGQSSSQKSKGNIMSFMAQLTSVKN